MPHENNTAAAVSCSRWIPPLSRAYSMKDEPASHVRQTHGRRSVQQGSSAAKRVPTTTKRAQLAHPRGD